MSAVVITRPAPSAHTLVQAVEALGFTAIWFPTLLIGPAPDPALLRATLARLEQFRLAIFVSPNAIDGALDALERRWPAQVAIGVMGPGSVMTLAGRGLNAPEFRIVSPPDGASGGAARFDSESLYEVLDWEALGTGPVLFIKGNGGRTWLADALTMRGIAIEVVQSYTRTVPPPDPEAGRAMLDLVERGARAQLIVTSSESVTNVLVLLEALGGRDARQWALGQRLIVPHARIAENATAQGFGDVVLSGPGDANIVRALK